jgi:hypothetical protein
MGFAPARCAFALPILHSAPAARRQPVGNHETQRRCRRCDEGTPGDIDDHHRPGPVLEQRQRGQLEGRVAEEAEQRAIEQGRAPADPAAAWRRTSSRSESLQTASSTNSVINILILGAHERRVAKPLAVFAAGSITRHPRWMSDDRSIFDLNTDAGTYRRLVSRRPSSVRSPCPSCRSQAQCAGDLSLHPR